MASVLECYMSQSEKISIRLNPLYLIIVSLPLLAFLFFAYDSLQRGLRPTLPYDMTCPSGNCHSYQPPFRIVPPRDPPSYGLGNTLPYDVAEARSNQLFLLGIGIAYGLLALVYLILLLLPTMNSFILWENNRIQIHSRLFTPLLRAYGFQRLVHSLHRWRTSPDVTIPLDAIISFKIITTSPLIPNRTDISQINWREIVIIKYGQNQEAVIELYVFPGFKKIVQTITRLRPEIPISFTKNTLLQNMAEMAHNMTRR